MTTNFDSGPRPRRRGEHGTGSGGRFEVTSRIGSPRLPDVDGMTMHAKSSSGSSVPPAVHQADTDVYFSADIETDGPIPGPYSMLSVGLVVAGSFDGTTFHRPARDESWYAELKPISAEFEADALAVNRIDRKRLLTDGQDPVEAMTKLAKWVDATAAGRTPVLVAYPLSFDWAFLYWYFVRFSTAGCPFNHSRCFDLKTAYAVKARRTVGRSGRNSLPAELRGPLPHTHHALEDAREQAEIFARLFEWRSNG